MLRLRTFGGLSLERDGAPIDGASAQRKALAVLAQLAVAGDRGVSRSKLVGRLWAERDEELARRALAQALYQLRQTVREDALVLGSAEVRLNPAAIVSDVAEFESALAAGDCVRAATVYAGPFVDGVYISDAPEFERWVDGERVRLAGMYAKAVESLATAPGTSPADAVQWWRRLANVDPLNARTALGLMRALAAAGNSAAALDHARVYEALVREELEAEPDARILAYANELRAPVPLPVRPVQRLDAPVAAPVETRRGIWWLALPALAGALIALGLVNLPAVTGLGGGTRRSALVADVGNATGDPVFDRALTLALTSGLEQSPRVSVLPRPRIREALGRMRLPADTMVDEGIARELAVREGIGLVIVPAIARADSSFVLTVHVIDATSGGSLVTESARAPRRARVIDAVDELARDLRSDFGESLVARVSGGAPLPRVTTGSLDALKKYADGMDAWSTQHFDQAERLWQTAVALDSDFVYAHMMLGVADDWVNRRSSGDSEFTHALRLIDRLPDREQMLVRARIAQERGEYADAIAFYQSLVRQHADDRAALFGLGYSQMRANRDLEALDAFRRVTALDARNWAAYVDIATIDRKSGRFRDALAAYHQAFAIAPEQVTSTVINGEYGGTYLSLDLPDSADLVFRQMLPLSPQQRKLGYQSLVFRDVWIGQYTAALAHLDSALVIDVMEHEFFGEARRRLFMATLYGELGAVDRMRTQLDSVYLVLPKAHFEPQMLMRVGRLLARTGAIGRAQEVLDTMIAHARRESQPDQSAVTEMQGELALAQGHAREARARFTMASALWSSQYPGEASAYGAWRDGDLTAAAQAYRALSADPSCCAEWVMFTRTAPFALGQIEEARGDTVAAIGAYESLLRQWPRADTNLIPVRESRRRLDALRRAPPIG